MLAPGRLAIALNGIVASALGACGGNTDHQVVLGGGGAGAAGGDRPLNDAGSDGRVERGGASAGGRDLVDRGGAGGSAAGAGGLGVAGETAGGSASGGSASGGSAGVLAETVCDEQGLLLYVQGLRLPEPVDYLGVYLVQAPGATLLYQSSGTVCAGASALAECQAALAAGTPTEGFPYMYVGPTMYTTLPSYSFMYLAYTRGNEVGFVTSRAQLNALLGEIDTANEAALTFLTMTASPACNSIWETAEGYSFSIHAFGGCSFLPPGLSYSVTRAGDARSMTFGMAMPCVGRRPHGLCPDEAAHASPLARYYANVAFLEDAAVLAFERMLSELSRFGAPPELLAAAERSLADERRHHREMAALARREGAEVPRARAEANARRSRLAAAIENATEGCVREAWGALSAHYQAATAADPAVRGSWQRIARDETEHAELSFALHQWFMLGLDIDERALVDAALQRARLELRVELAAGDLPHPSVLQHAGVPEPGRAAALFRELEAVLEAAMADAA